MKKYMVAYKNASDLMEDYYSEIIEIIDIERMVRPDPEELDMNFLFESDVIYHLEQKPYFLDGGIKFIGDYDRKEVHVFYYEEYLEDVNQ